MKLLKFLLYPFSQLYFLITSLRNHLFDIGYSRSFKFETNVIGIGNLSVGGTGKTPHVEYLIRLLKNHYKIATLSRGYKRKSKGILIANTNTSANLIGDEPFQFYSKYGKEISVAVGEERALAIPVILHETDTNLILLDDAYQHRSVTPDLNILLTDYNHLFYEDFLLPAGRLRESRKGAKRADLIVVTKCPTTLSGQEEEKIKSEIRKYSRQETPVFFTTIKYLSPKPILQQHAGKISKNIFLLAGIAKTEPLIEQVKKEYTLSGSLLFDDHHSYSPKDIKTIKEQLKGKNNVSLLTTEKDMVKLIDEDIMPHIQDIPIFYIPIEISFLKDQHYFDEIIFKSIKLPA